VLAFHRWVPSEGRDVVIVANLSEHTHYNYQLGFPPRFGTASMPPILLARPMGEDVRRTGEGKGSGDTARGEVVV